MKSPFGLIFLCCSIALLLWVGVLVARADFDKSTNYMSQRGYARWQTYLTTGVWEPR